MMAGLVEMSIAGAAMALAVVLARAMLFGRLPKRAFTVLWLLVALRLLVPLWVPAPTSAYNLAGPVRDAWVQAQASAGLGDGVPAADAPAGTAGDRQGAGAAPTPVSSPAGLSAAAAGATRTADEAEDASPSATLPDNGLAGVPAGAAFSLDAASPDAGSAIAPIAGGDAADAPPGSAALSGEDVLFVVWMAGALVCVTVFSTSYLRLRKRLRTAVRVADPRVDQWLAGHLLRVRTLRILQSDRIGTPLTRGIVRPVIVVPASFSWDDEERASYVLAHELVHVRRFDTLFKGVLVAAVCLHWFNPFAWVALALANRDIEHACDEEVVRAFGLASRKRYAHALLDMEAGRGELAPLYSGFGKTAIERRIGAIMGIKKTSAAAVAASLVLVVAIPAAFATSATTGGPDAPAAGSVAEPYVATPGSGQSAEELPINCTAEEWAALRDFVGAQFAPDAGAENHTTVAEFRRTAEREFGDGAGSNLLERLSADENLHTLAQTHSAGSSDTASDAAVAALVYYGLLPAVSDGWEAPVFSGAVPMPDGSGDELLYRLTLRVEDPDITYAKHCVDAALSFEQRAGDLLDLAVAYEPADANELLQAFGIEVRNEYVGTVRLYSDVSMLLTYSVASEVEELATGGTEITVAEEDFASRLTLVREVTAIDLVSELEPYGVSIGSLTPVDDADMPGAFYYPVTYQGQDVARIYDAQMGCVVTELFQPFADVMYDLLPDDTLDLIVERDANGEPTGVCVADEGEVDALLAAVPAAVGASGTGDGADVYRASREIGGYTVPQTDNGYTDAEWEQVVDLWAQVDGNPDVTIAELRVMAEEAGFRTPDGSDLLGRFASDGRLLDAARGESDIASFVCNTLAQVIQVPGDAQYLFQGTAMRSFYAGAASAVFQYTVTASIEGDPAEVPVLDWQHAVEQTLAAAETVLDDVDEEDLLDGQLMGYMIGDLVAADVELHSDDVSLLVNGTYSCTAGEQSTGAVTVSPVVVDRVQPAFPVNENGQTYGSGAVAFAYASGGDPFSAFPDLIAVVGDNGVEGYVLKEDYVMPTPSNPEEALAMMESGAFNRTVPVYAEDGETVVDTFTFG